MSLPYQLHNAWFVPLEWSNQRRRFVEQDDTGVQKQENHAKDPRYRFNRLMVGEKYRRNPTYDTNESNRNG
jgi:hypothetical protein